MKSASSSRRGLSQRILPEQFIDFKTSKMLEIFKSDS
jgi:hypothetical protein